MGFSVLHDVYKFCFSVQEGLQVSIDRFVETLNNITRQALNPAVAMSGKIKHVSLFKRLATFHEH